MIFNFNIINDSLSLTSDFAAYSGNENYYLCKFNFLSPDWQELSKFAVFTFDDTAISVPLSGDECMVPSQVLEQNGSFYLGVFGTNASETDFLRISTGLVCLSVGDGAYKKGSTPSVPAPDVWETYLASVQKYVALAQESAAEASVKAGEATAAYDGVLAAQEITNTEFEEKLDTLKSKSIPHTTASGYPISLNDHLEGENAINYRIYGNSVQNGEPTAESPVEIQSVGTLVTDTTNEYYGKYDIPVAVCGKNLIDYDKTLSVTRVLNDTPQELYAIIKPGQTYTLSSYIDNSANSSGKARFRISVGYGSSQYEHNYSFYIGALASGTQSVKFTVPNDYNGKVNMQLSTESGTAVFSKFMLSYSDDTEYEPYTPVQKIHIYLDEPLRKLGDYADYIDWENQKVMRQIEVLDDTGTKTIDESLGILEASTEETITVPVISAPNSELMHISTDTKVSPSKIDLTYCQDINKVITSLTNAILAQGGNV